MVSKYSDDDKRLLDICRESRYEYWNALLTLNGILLSVFAAVALIGQLNKWLILVLMVSCIESAGLLILNFSIFKKMYEELAQKDFSEITEEQRQADLKHAVTQHEIIEKNEKGVLKLLFLEALIIFLLFFY